MGNLVSLQFPPVFMSAYHSDAAPVPSVLCACPHYVPRYKHPSSAGKQRGLSDANSETHPAPRNLVNTRGGDPVRRETPTKAIKTLVQVAQRESNTCSTFRRVSDVRR